MRTARWIVVALIPLLLPTLAARGDDWPIYRGPRQDGISTEKVKLPWSGEGPKEVWRGEVHTGFSSFSIGGGKAFTQVVRDINGQQREICLALDAATGKELWFADIARGTGYDGGGDGDGPRSTPTYNDGMVYLLTPDLVARCVSADDGKQVWVRDLMRQHAGRNIGWNSAASVAIDGDLVFVGGGGPGQSVLALNKKTGEVAWKALDEHITHATPVVATIHGKRQIIFFMQSGLVSLDTANGAVLWRFPFRYNVSTAASPVVSGDIVYCSAAYGVGSTAYRIEQHGDSLVPKKLWFTAGDDIANHWSTPVCHNGYLYGMYGCKKFKTGPIKCVELATGKVMWQQKGFGQGHLILVGNRLMALSDTGYLVVAEARPSGYKEVCRTRAFTDKCWTTPAISDGKVFVRSIGHSACFDLGK